MKRCKFLTILSVLILTNLNLSAQYINYHVGTDSLKNNNLLNFRPSIFKNENPQALIKKFDSASLPLFCRIEHKIELKSKIAFRFRLGDLNYVNMLENKR